MAGLRFITLEQIKRQCVLENDQEEESYLELLGMAAEEKVEADLNRTLYVDEVPDTDSTGLVPRQHVCLAMLLLVGHFYNNREATSELTMKEVPLAYQDIIGQHRIRPL